MIKKGSLLYGKRVLLLPPSYMNPRSEIFSETLEVLLLHVYNRILVQPHIYAGLDPFSRCHEKTPAIPRNCAQWTLSKRRDSLRLVSLGGKGFWRISESR